jgi:hypothetical protein
LASDGDSHDVEVFGDVRSLRHPVSNGRAPASYTYPPHPDRTRHEYRDTRPIRRGGRIQVEHRSGDRPTSDRGYRVEPKSAEHASVVGGELSDVPETARSGNLGDASPLRRISEPTARLVQRRSLPVSLRLRHRLNSSIVEPRAAKLVTVSPVAGSR